MKTLKEKLSQLIFYDVLSIIIAIALPIALKNGHLGFLPDSRHHLLRI